MKTPEEIKRGLVHCSNDSTFCNAKCPYFNASSNGVDCATEMHGNGLAYIQQLERERDALREGLKTELGCNACKHFDNDAEYVSNECMDCGKKKCNWKWRGVEEEKHET